MSLKLEIVERNYMNSFLSCNRDETSSPSLRCNWRRDITDMTVITVEMIAVLLSLHDIRSCSDPYILHFTF